MRPQVGQIINNKYRLVRLIGDGGMGSVFEARHEVLGTTVALKFLHAELTRRPGLVQRFLQEARVSAQIQSPHVVKVTDVDQTASGLAFIVMEYLEGRTLQALYEDLYREGRRLTYVEALEYAMQMLEGVEAAHAAGIVHRDLKPDNVMITRGKRGEPIIKLLDFGIAKLKVTGQMDRGLTRPGVIMGTPEYMAPEQAYSADAVDARADIFSLGVIVFEMLAGRRPVGGDEPQQIASQYLSGQVARLTDLMPSLAPELGNVLQRAMAPMPKDRFASVSELRQALEPFAVTARAPSALASQNEERRASDGYPAPPPDHVLAVGPSARHAPVAAVSGVSGGVPKTIPPDPSPQAGPSALPGASMVGAQRNPGVPATASNPPLQPYGGIPPTGYTPVHADMSPRPGGTAIGSPLAMPVQSATQHGYAADAYAGAGAAPMPYPGAPPPRAAARRSSGVSFFTILLLAAAFAGVAVGGVYLASQVTSREHSDDVRPLAPTPTSAPSSTPTAEPPSTLGQNPVLPPPVDLPQKPSPVTPTRPNPSAKPTASQPPVLPSVFVIPSALPIPGLPPFGGAQPPSQPGPTPPSEPTSSPRPPGTGPRPIVIPVPRRD